RAAVFELCLSPAEAIVAATRTAAEALGLEDRGVLLPARRADLLVVEGNPLRDPACLENVRAVMKAGRWVSTPCGAIRYPTCDSRRTPGFGFEPYRSSGSNGWPSSRTQARMKVVPSTP